MDKLLHGADMAEETLPRKPDRDKWAVYQETAQFMAVTAPADTTEGGNASTSNSADRSAATINENNIPLLDIIAATAKLSPVRVKCNDAAKGETSHFVIL